VTESLYPMPLTMDADWTADTVAVQAGRPARSPGAPMNPPITASSTYVQDAALEYGRDGNAGWGALETALGALDDGHAVTFASGLAATTAIADLVPAGGTVVLSTVTYYGVRNIFERMQAHGRLHLQMVAADDTEAVLAAADGAAMVWVESIANPLMVVADVPAIAAGARERGAITVVDATFATPLRQRPLAMGADIVLHSATKLIGGHSDLLLGAAVCRDSAHADDLVAYRHDHGAIPGALETFLALRGLRTLAVRLDRSEASAAELARRLTSHPHVSRVYYPGLPGDSQHERATRVLPIGAGSMLSFDGAGTVEQTEAFLARLRLLTHATSLGGVESLIERRARYAGDASLVSPSLCRVSVGIENVEDLWADLDRALLAAFD
jgi:cystathionine gamma-synthase